MKRLGTYRYNIYTMGAFVDIIFSPSKYKGNKKNSPFEEKW